METRKHTQLKCSSCLFVAKDEKRLGTHEKQHGYKGEFVCDACNYSHDDQKVREGSRQQSDAQNQCVT